MHVLYTSVIHVLTDHNDLIFSASYKKFAVLIFAPLESVRRALHLSQLVSSLPKPRCHDGPSFTKTETELETAPQKERERNRLMVDEHVHVLSYILGGERMGSTYIAAVLAAQRTTTTTLDHLTMHMKVKLV